MIRWQGRGLDREEQVANAKDSFVDLTPASEASAEQVRSNWLPLKRGQAIPLIGERVHGDEEE